MNEKPPKVWIHEQRPPAKIKYSKVKHTPDGMCVESEELNVQGHSLSHVEKVFDRKREQLWDENQRVCVRSVRLKSVQKKRL
jgi:hypothetical protein